MSPRAVWGHHLDTATAPDAGNLRPFTSLAIRSSWPLDRRTRCALPPSGSSHRGDGRGLEGLSSMFQ